MIKALAVEAEVAVTKVVAEDIEVAVEAAAATAAAEEEATTKVAEVVVTEAEEAATEYIFSPQLFYIFLQLFGYI